MIRTDETRKLCKRDIPMIRDLYQDAIESAGCELYNEEQIRAWSSLAYLPGVLDQALIEGKGWVVFHNKVIKSFAVRFPSDRLALLYSRGKYTRRGYGKLLLSLIEKDAKTENISKLFTEASLYSYPLLLKCGWVSLSVEYIKIGGIDFKRFLMEKELI